LVPYLKAAAELKTKPTQHSVGQLREIGIQPDILICRTEREMSHDDKEKISLFCNVPIEAVIEEKDKDFSIYEVPLSLHSNKLDQLIIDQLSLPAGPIDLTQWQELLHTLRNPEHEISIAVVGKYAEHKDAYKSIYEAIDHAGIHHKSQIRLGRIQSEAVETEGAERLLAGFDGILVPGGFGERGIEGKVNTIKYARERGIPFFGICLGMQCAAIEFARNVIGLTDAHSTEFKNDTTDPVICLLDEQKNITEKGGTMRLGTQPCKLEDDSIAKACYAKEEISERHRHRYEFNNVYRQQFAAHGMTFTGQKPDGSLVEIVEIEDHPWFLAAQFHPEFKSKPIKAHPLFAGFIEAAIQRRKDSAQTSPSPEATPAT
jgi:CTP synthase